MKEYTRTLLWTIKAKNIFDVETGKRLTKREALKKALFDENLFLAAEQGIYFNS